MPNDAITQNTVKWAQKHDWGLDAYLDNGTIKGLSDWGVSEGAEDIRILAGVTFTSREELRIWAGY